MFFYLKVSCKDKKILEKFIRVFTKIKSLPIFIKPFPKHEKRKFITILKSPHVNKTAQEQFEYRFFSKHFLVFSVKPQIFFLFLKKLKNLSFSGIKLEVKGVFEKNVANKYVLKLINPDNIVLQPSYLNQKSFRKEKTKSKDFKSVITDLDLVKKYIQLFDSYGEIYLKNTFYG
uniref:Ribosomal protein S10 n=1 Tax=Pseudo-nitzschia delicatissima TaxID=44447 RepID=A0A8B6QMZ5_9STRA|nr:ribosomal protein S10 [Pseudo-nitzschia delicatissima]QTJ30088.1 ribosomal protein S10 [Pseudo-nitzschia delicatissima]